MVLSATELRHLYETALMRDRLAEAAELIGECIARLGYPVGMGNPPSDFFCRQLAQEIRKILETK